jgi:predicted AAA+ superfamily ATPase
MDLSDAKQIVAEWLEDWESPELVPRDLTVQDISRLSDILAIVGPRRAGKTFFMYLLIKELIARKKCTREEILFVDFEDYRLSDMSARDIDKLFVAFNQLVGKDPTYLFFDEVHHLPQWSRVLRTLHNRRKFRIVVSGSNSQLLSSEIARELRGRYRDVVMLPLCFREALRFRGIRYTKRTVHTSARGRLIRAFDEYLDHGGFPEVLRGANKSERRNLIQSYYRTIFYRDLLERYNIKARSVLDAVMRSALEGYAALFSISRIEKQLKANDLSVSKRTIANYLGYLQDAFFCFIHEKYAYSMRKRIMNPKKVYLVDPGFIVLVSEPSKNRGRLLENVVAIELHRRQREVYYHKERQECDFVVVEGGRPTLAIQVCWRIDDDNLSRECGGLREAMNAWNIKRGLILTYEQEEIVEWRNENYPVVPVWKWLLEQGDTDDGYMNKT